jgi:hypothetical protein
MRPEDRESLIPTGLCAVAAGWETIASIAQLEISLTRARLNAMTQTM